MRLRKTYLVEDVTTTTTGTKTYNLDFTDPIVAIYLDFLGQRYDNSDTNRPYLLEDIDKIEIVDGSDVLYSTDGTRCAATQLYQTGKINFMAISANNAATYNRQSVKILFGRNESDTEFALDVTRFNNPQIKITHSYAEAAGSWAAGTQTMTIQVLVAEGAPKPRGFFMTKDIYSWTKATSGDETIDLPRDYPYRFIVMQAIHCATPVYEEFTRVKISCNYDEFVPINDKGEDLAHDNWNRYGMLTQQTECIGDGADVDIKAYYPFAWNWGGDVQSWNSGASAVVKRPYSGYITVGALATGAALSGVFTHTFLASSQRALITGQGWELFDTEVIPFGDIMKESHWFNPKPWQSLRLILTQAQTAVTAHITAQQVRYY